MTRNLHTFFGPLEVPPYDYMCMICGKHESETDAMNYATAIAENDIGVSLAKEFPSLPVRSLDDLDRCAPRKPTIVGILDVIAGR